MSKWKNESKLRIEFTAHNEHGDGAYELECRAFNGKCSVMVTRQTDGTKKMPEYVVVHVGKYDGTVEEAKSIAMKKYQEDLM